LRRLVFALSWSTTDGRERDVIDALAVVERVITTAEQVAVARAEKGKRLSRSNRRALEQLAAKLDQLRHRMLVIESERNRVEG
jgi:hypothetical protein